MRKRSTTATDTANTPSSRRRGSPLLGEASRGEATIPHAISVTGPAPAVHGNVAVIMRKGSLAISPSDVSVYSNDSFSNSDSIPTNSIPTNSIPTDSIPANRDANGITCSAHAPDQSAIERRAYELWEQEGKPEGRAVQHWLQAVQELCRV